MKKPKRKSIFDLPKKRCAFAKCNKLFKPTFAYMKYHSSKCRMDDHNQKKIDMLRRAYELDRAQGV